MSLHSKNKNTQVPIEFKDSLKSSERKSNQKSSTRQFCLNCGNGLHQNGQSCEKCGNSEITLLWKNSN